MPGGHTGTDMPNPTAFPAFQAAISGPKAGNAQTHANMAPISNEHKSVQGLYGEIWWKMRNFAYQQANNGHYRHS